MKILILYDYFLPAYRAGGPIQSIANIIRNLHPYFELYVITSNSDLNKIEPLNVVSDTWQDFEHGKASVIYLSFNNKKILHIKKLIEEINPDKIFANGIYSIPFSIAPAFFFPNKMILHVRGMLHPGALLQKGLKKKLFLGLIKLLRIHKKITFCVSDEKEMVFTQLIFGKKTKIHVAQNFPTIFLPIPPKNKTVGILNLISIALISPIKNHNLILQALSLVKSQVSWDIYGPIKDLDYWGHCKKLISKLPTNIKVTYKGEVNPFEIHDVLKNSHVFILPSQSENFGHALYEAMIAGKPIITSNNTPWNLLSENNAGYNVNLTANDISNAIEEAAILNQNEYGKMVLSVRKYAENALNVKEIKKHYLDLFRN
jgi:glycosyltransferase involved in cell wall biosynthesis